MKHLEGVSRLLLASASPRRRQLLAGLDVETVIVNLRDVDESYPEDMLAEDVALYVATKKRDAYDVSELAGGDVLVTADTVVIEGAEVMGKPSSREDAIDMLRRLSGNVHRVVTGVTLSSKENTVGFSAVTEVKFAALDDSEIEYYVDHYRPFDKAGAYGIQEWIGFIGIEGINGCYYNVMGLPLHELYRNLKTFF